MADVRYVEATKLYPGNDAPAVNALDLHIEDGEFMVLVGPPAPARRLRFACSPVSRRSTPARSSSATATSPTSAPKKRDVAMVFQNYALYPYFTVEANIGFPLKIARVKKSERDPRPGGRGAARPHRYLERKPGSCPAASGSASRWDARSSASPRSS